MDPLIEGPVVIAQPICVDDPGPGIWRTPDSSRLLDQQRISMGLPGLAV